ncbi:hypothetical protein PoMZ_08441 [Pyricularia oryzae]|uniref:Uncharacterized protein n=1 Tax=Pyricularia oryzae TaxID=318829 RepID=A0A4P7NHM5_PYROR|nr:hypothetical protein PoMZ_08441 [Pyricularia oryzae]
MDFGNAFDLDNVVVGDNNICRFTTQEMLLNDDFEDTFDLLQMPLYPPIDASIETVLCFLRVLGSGDTDSPSEVANTDVDEAVGEDMGEPSPRERRDLAILFLFPVRVGVDAEVWIAGDEATDKSGTTSVSSLGKHASRGLAEALRAIPGSARVFLR